MQICVVDDKFIALRVNRWGHLLWVT